MTTEDRTVPAYLQKIAADCVARIDGLHITGPKRQADAALHIFLGASVGLEAAGRMKAALHVQTVAGMLIAVRGMDEVRELAKATPRDTAGDYDATVDGVYAVASAPLDVLGVKLFSTEDAARLNRSTRAGRGDIVYMSHAHLEQSPPDTLTASPLDGVSVEDARRNARRDATCALCETGEQPGHEH